MVIDHTFVLPEQKHENRFVSIRLQDGDLGPIHLIRPEFPFSYCWKDVYLLDHYLELTPYEELFDCDKCRINYDKERP